MKRNRLMKFNPMKLGLVLSIGMAVHAVASLEDLSDYSEHGTGHQYLEAYPEQRSQAGFPEFSWDTIPKWIIVRKGDDAMTTDEINSLATNYYVIIHEKYNRLGTDYTDDGIAWVSGEIKAVNPKVKNFFYWNSRIQWPSTTADEYLTNNHPEWLKDPEAWPIFFDHDAPGMTDWWLESILGWVVPNDDIEGIFVDSFNRYTVPVFNEDGTPINNYVGMLNTLYDALWQQAPEKITVFNGLGNIASNGNREHMRYHDGTYLEAMMSTNADSDPAQTMADALMVQVQLHREALSKGKFFLHRGGPNHQTYYTGEEEPSDDAAKEDYFVRNIDFTLAIYLMMAEKYAYFWYGESDVITDEYCDTSAFEVFSKPLGEPLGPPTRNGYEYSRSFKYLDVSINFETGETSFDWKDKATVDTNLIVNITAPVSGVALKQGDSVTIEASATDSDATIAKVEFYNGATKLGEDTTAPYSFDWDDLPAGNHTITAMAYDTDGNSTNSLEIYIAAKAVDPMSLDASDVVMVSAADPIDEGSTSGDFVVRERDVDTSLLTRHISAFINFDLSTMASFDPAGGDYAELSIEFQGRLNSTGTSALRVGQVTGGAWNSSSLPSYNWATASGSTAGPGSQIREATLISDVATVTLNQTYTVDISDIVDAWVNGGESNYGLGLYLESVNQGAGFGNVKLVGSWAGSGTIEPNTAPVLYVTSPEDDERVVNTEGVYAYASDVDGSISQVDFYMDGSLVKTDTEAPYNYRWSGLSGGVYSFTAVATDNEGETSIYSVRDVLKYPDSFANLALDKNTSQSSTSSGAYSSRAVDGNTDGDFNNDSVTHTLSESNAWWEVDLAAEYNIGEIRLFNRSALQDRLSDFTVSVLDSDGVATFSQSINEYPDPSMSVDAGGAPGQVVRVQLNGENALSLAEVEVYENANNLALGKSTEQSSTLTYQGERGAFLAVDGDTNGEFFNGSVTHTHKDGPSPAWWEVDLGSDINVRNIRVFNRTDSNMGRLQYFTVYVIDSAGTTNWSQSFTEYPDPSVSMDAGGAVGRTVRIGQDSTEVLSLAEVEVYGNFTMNTYSAWVFHEYGMTGADALSFIDSDGDELSNFGEYAFGGNPLDGSDVGYSSALGAGGEEVTFVYPRRIGSDGELDYTLEFCSNLISNDWQTGTYTELPATGILDADYESVTNRIDITGKTNEFIRLNVENIK